MSVIVNKTERKVSVTVKKAKDGKDFNFDELTEAQKDEFRWDLSLLQSDGTFIMEDNFIRANVSTYKESFAYVDSKVFTLAFIPTNFLIVQRIKADGSIHKAEYTWDSNLTLTITSELLAGDSIETIYEHFITQL